jgi:flagellin
LSFDVRTNITALNVLNNVDAVNNAISQSQEQLATGKRINTPGDDPIGISTVNKIKAHLSAYQQGVTNVQNGINLLETAKGGLDQQKTLLNSISAIATNAFNDGAAAVSGDYSSYNDSINTLLTNFNNLAYSTVANGIEVLRNDGGQVNIQFGQTPGESVDLGGYLPYKAETGGTDYPNLPSSVLFTTRDDVSNFLDNVLNESTTGAFTVNNQLINQVDNAKSSLNLFLSANRDIVTSLTKAKTSLEDIDSATALANLTSQQTRQKSILSLLTQATNIPALSLRLISA